MQTNKEHKHKIKLKKKQQQQNAPKHHHHREHCSPKRTAAAGRDARQADEAPAPSFPVPAYCRCCRPSAGAEWCGAPSAPERGAARAERRGFLDTGRRVCFFCFFFFFSRGKEFGGHRPAPGEDGAGFGKAERSAFAISIKVLVKLAQPRWHLKRQTGDWFQARSSLEGDTLVCFLFLFSL